MGAAALEAARAAGRPARWSPRRPPRWPWARPRRARSSAAREHRDEALEQVDRLSDAELAPRLEALYYLGWAENYLERYDDAIAPRRPRPRHRPRHRPGAAAGADDAGQGLPVRDAGPAGRGARAVRGRGRVRAPVGQPALPVLGAVRAGLRALPPGRPGRAIAACEESARVGGRMAGGTMPAAGGGPGWVLASALFEAGELERGFAYHARARRRGARATRSRSSAATTGSRWRWRELARGRLEEAEEYVRRAEELAATLDLTCPRRWRRARARRCCWPPGDAARRRRPRRPRPPRRAAAGARLQAASPTALRGPGAGGRRRARGGRRRCCARPSASWTRAARTASATRCGASCASSARAPSRAARRPAGTPAWRR